MGKFSNKVSDRASLQEVVIVYAYKQTRLWIAASKDSKIVTDEHVCYVFI